MFRLVRSHLGLALCAASSIVGCSSDTSVGGAPLLDAGRSAHSDGNLGGAHDAGVREEAWVSNSGETTISIIDHESRAVTATIQLGLPSDGGALRGIAHGIAVTHSGEVVYAGTEDSGEVIAIDTRNRAISWRLHAGKSFQLATLSADDRRLFVPDIQSNSIVIVDTAMHAVEREIRMTEPADAGTALRGLHNMYTSYDGSAVFATAIFSQKVARIDAATLEIDRLYAIDGQPRPAAFTRDLSTMYVQLSSLNGFVALDLATGAETRRIAIPEDGTRPPGWDGWTFAHGVYLTEDESELWVDSVVAGKAYVYSVPALDQLATLDVGIMPRWFAATRDETTLYLTNTTPAADHGTVSVIDRRRRKVVATLDVGRAPKDVHMVGVPR